MKAIEQYFPVVLFIILYKVVLFSESKDEILKCDHSSKSYWVILSCGKTLALSFESFESVDEILKCDHSNESYLLVLF